MGCCIQNREDPLLAQKTNFLIDPKGKLSNKIISKYIFSGENNADTKVDNVKNYFINNASTKENLNPNSINNLNANVNSNSNNSVILNNYNANNSQNQSGQIETQNNTVTFNNNNAHSLFKVFRKSSQNVDSSVNQNSEREKKEKENSEITEKIRASHDSRYEDKIIKYPRVDFLISNSKTHTEESRCVITPNSINNQLKKLGEKFYFGREDPKLNKPNHYNFKDESIGIRQFEIAYNIDKGKFFLVDNKRGTGLFIKIRQKICVDHDMIVSFCASHMILQLEGENDKRPKSIKVRFLQGPHQNQDWTFNPNDKKCIRIGRSKSAEIVYKDDSVSRIQCTLSYENNNWYLYDGFLDTGNKGSTNGLWLLASSKVEVTNDMVLKTGNTTIKVILTDKR